MWAAVAAAAAAEEEGGRGRGEEGEVMSVMALLHNFSEREQKESEGKWKARKEGACCILGGEAWHRLVFLFQFFVLPNWLRECRGVTQSLYMGVKQRCSHRGVGTIGCCYSRSNKGADTHRPTHALTVEACTHL